MIRTLVTLLVQEFCRPRPFPTPEWLVELDANPLTPKQTGRMLDGMGGGLWLAVVDNEGRKRTDKEALNHLLPRRRNARKVAR
jgi:hypothetical protein